MSYGVDRAIFPVLPGLKSFWFFDAADGSGNAIDMTGNGNLSRAGDPQYSAIDKALHINLDGIDDYLFHADNALYDIRGTESYIDPSIRGLTIGGWFRFDLVAGNKALVTKWNTGSNNISYEISINSSDQFRMRITGDGRSPFAFVNNPTVTIQNKWYFAAGVYKPSDTISMWTDANKETNVTTLPSIFNSTAQLQLGRQENGSSESDMRMSMVFICAAAVPDELILNFYYTSKPLFNP